MAPTRIRIELHGNIDFRKYHVTGQISSEKLHGGLMGGSRFDPFKQISFGGAVTELGDDTKATINRFYEIDGIDTVGLDRTIVAIGREPAYNWNDFEPQIIATITDILGWNEEEVAVEYLLDSECYDHEPLEEQLAYMKRIRAEFERESRFMI